MHSWKREGLTSENSQSAHKLGEFSGLRSWVLAVRPRTLTAAIAPVLIGTAMAFADGGFHAASALAALAGALLIQIGTNLANDYFDFKKGADTATRVGPRRATQAGLIKPESMLRASVLVFALAFLVGTYLAFRGGWPIIAIGIASLISGMLYTAGPFALAYIGLGDLFVLAFFGPIAVGGTYYVQTLKISPEALIAGLAPGLLSVAILAVNNTRDIEDDRRAGKKTLPARFGRTFGQIEYITAIVLATLIPLFIYLSSGRKYQLIAMLILLPAVSAFKYILRFSDGPSFNKLLAYTAKLLLAYSALFSAGWMLK